MIIYSNESSRGRCGGLMAVPLRRENINACFFKTRLGLCTNGKRRKTKPEFWSCNAGPTLFLPVWGPGTHIYMHTHTCSDIRTLRETLQPEKTTPFTMGLNQTACQEHQCERGGAKRVGSITAMLQCVCVCVCRRGLVSLWGEHLDMFFLVCCGCRRSLCVCVSVCFSALLVQRVTSLHCLVPRGFLFPQTSRYILTDLWCRNDNQWAQTAKCFCPLGAGGEFPATQIMQTI